jgi:hypothetical protein
MNNSPTEFARPAVESVENVESKPVAISTFSTNLTSTLDLQIAIFPPGSWFDRYMDYARSREESADSYLIGAIIPVFAAALARRVSFVWGDRWIYPNIYAMLAGKPGDRKSSAINLADEIAKKCLERRCFLPDAMSAEALFDEYDDEKGGSPDKILIADDANSFLGLIQKSNYGERVGQRLLTLYDCKGFLEAFRRNNDGEKKTGRREINSTSTSMILGATYNICQFHGHAIRSGLQRRFLYYIAEKHGRFIPLPPESAHMDFLNLIKKLQNILSIKSLEFSFSPDARVFWVNFQSNNRQEMEKTGFENDAHISRLNGQPDHVLKLAIIFELSLWLEMGGEPPKNISLMALETAILHTDHCIRAGQALDQIANRVKIQSDADILLAKIQIDFPAFQQNGEIILTRTQLTGKYAHHANRPGTLKPDDIYIKIIPDLIRRGKAREIKLPGKTANYSFRAESE